MKTFLEIMGLIFVNIIGAGLICGILWALSNFVDYIARYKSLNERIHFLFDKLIELEKEVYKKEKK